MPTQRIKGQETTILFVRATVLEDSLTDVTDFEVELKFELKEQGYLGELSNRHDEIFNGAKFTCTLHLHNTKWFVFRNAIKDRAQRRTPDVVFNITSVLNFPDGSSAAQLLPDVKFGAQPLSIRSRGDYVTVKLEGACDDENVTTS